MSHIKCVGQVFFIGDGISLTLLRNVTLLMKENEIALSFQESQTGMAMKIMILLHFIPYSDCSKFSFNYCFNKLYIFKVSTWSRFRS